MKMQTHELINKTQNMYWALKGNDSACVNCYLSVSMSFQNTVVYRCHQYIFKQQTLHSSTVCFYDIYNVSKKFD